MNKIERAAGLARFLFYKLIFNGRFSSRGRSYFKKGSFDILKPGVLTLGPLNIFNDAYDIEVKGGQLVIGAGNYFNKNVKFVCLQKIEIGDNCLLADSVHIYDHDHRYETLEIPLSQQGYATRPVKIGNNVWMGAKATILKGVTIADGAVIGAGAVVTKDVPPFAVVAGNPARVIRIRGHAG